MPEIQIERDKYEHDADIHDESWPEVVSEKQDIDANDDSDHHDDVNHD